LNLVAVVAVGGGDVGGGRPSSGISDKGTRQQRNGAD